MISQGPFEGDRMTNGRVEMAVREVDSTPESILLC